MLDKAFALYTVLRDVRRQRGTLDFDLPEAQSRLDDLAVWSGSATGSATMRTGLSKNS